MRSSHVDGDYKFLVSFIRGIMATLVSHIDDVGRSQSLVRREETRPAKFRDFGNKKIAEGSEIDVKITSMLFVSMTSAKLN